jgi:hypothetical protein
LADALAALLSLDPVVSFVTERRPCDEAKECETIPMYSCDVVDY